MKRYIKKRDKKQEDLINLLVIAAPYYNVYMTDSNDYAEVNICDEDVNKESEILDSIREKLPDDNEYKNNTNQMLRRRIKDNYVMLKICGDYYNYKLKAVCDEHYDGAVFNGAS